MSDKKWHIIVKHAKTCLLNPRIHYVYYYDNNTKNNCIVFNSIYEFSGLIAGGQSYTTETLPDSEKVSVMYPTFSCISARQYAFGSQL